MINGGTKYDEPRLYGNRETDLNMKIWRKLNNVSNVRHTHE